LVILIASIEKVLSIFEKTNLSESIDPNPFNIEPDYSFNPEQDYIHDSKLLKTQLRYLNKKLDDIERYA